MATIRDKQGHWLGDPFTSMRLGEIFARLRAAGDTVSDEDLARISPLAYTQVIPNGTYVFDRT
jgi:hypothetical protein